MSRFQFVADHRDTFEVKWLCKVCEIARSSFYAWWLPPLPGPPKPPLTQALEARIRVVHDEDNTYGAPRITAELNDGAPETDRVNHKRVARVMRDGRGHRRLPAPTPGENDRARSGQPEGARSAGPRFHRRHTELQLCRRHYLLAVGHWRESVSGHGDRLLFTAGRGVGDR